MQKTLDKQKAEYDAQYAQYTQQKDMLSQLYRSSTKTQQELKAKQKKLREQNEAYEAERKFFNAFISLHICIFGLFLVFPELRGNADEELEVDAGHGAREYRKVVLVEEVVDGEF